MGRAFGRLAPVILAALAALVPAPSAFADGPSEADAPCADALAPASEAISDSDAGPADPAADGSEAEGAAEGSSPGIGTIALKDAVYVLGSPVRWSGKQWLAATAVAAGVVAFGFAFDIPARNKTQSHQTSALDELTKIVEPFGQEYSWAVIGAYGIAGFVFRDAGAKEIAIDAALASILASGIITPIMKQVVGRARPNQDEGSTSFDPFSGNQSFPSGHATQAFAVASVISAHSDRVWVSVAAYTLAGLVGFSRIYHDEHWSSDVAAGAIIGTAVGRGIVALNRRLRESHGGVTIAFAPTFGPQVKAAAILVRF